jgi:hypothetical protein
MIFFRLFVWRGNIATLIGQQSFHQYIRGRNLMLSYFRWDIGTLVLRLLLTDLAYFFLIKPWYYRWGGKRV